MVIVIIEFKVFLSCFYRSLSLSNSGIFSLKYWKVLTSQSTNTILEWSVVPGRVEVGRTIHTPVVR